MGETAEGVVTEDAILVFTLSALLPYCYYLSQGSSFEF